jgi:hypothetical protein
MTGIKVFLRESTGFAVLALASVFAISAHAGSILTTGFESPTYTVGAISGQNGWAILNPSASFDTIETTTVKSGSQAAWVIPTGTVQTGMFHADTASGGPIIDLSADLFIASSSTENQWQFAALGAGLAPLIGGIEILPSGQIFGITQTYPVLGTWTRDTFHHVDLLFNFNTQRYSVFLDGISIGSPIQMPFCGDNGPCTSVTPVSEGQFLSFFDVFATLNSNDLGVIDNLSLSSSSSVPEPATYLMIAAGLAAFGVRRRFQRS